MPSAEKHYLLVLLQKITHYYRQQIRLIRIVLVTCCICYVQCIQNYIIWGSFLEKVGEALQFIWGCLQEQIRPDYELFLHICLK